MKIAIFHNLPSGGARRAMVEIVKGLVRRGHTVDESCPETADLSFLPLDGYVRSTTVLPFRPLGVTRRRVPMLTPYITAARLLYDLRAIASVGQKAARHIGHQDDDVVFTHDCQLVLVPDVLRFLQQPAVHYWHIGTRGLSTEQPLSDPGVGLSERLKVAYYAPARSVYPRLRRRQTQRNLWAAGRVLTNSSFAAAELRQEFGVASHVCNYGVDLARFRPLDLPRQAFVLSVGAVHYYKGYRFLVRALGRLPGGQRPPLVIAANSVAPEELQILEALASELGVKLTIRSVFEDAEMAVLYNQAVAFVYCPIREPWGLAAVEAMACGTPVVAVGEGGVAESVVDGETGLLTGRDPEAFAAALGRVLSEPALARRLGAGGIARARAQFAWDNTVDRLEAHFQEIARTGAVP